MKIPFFAFLLASLWTAIPLAAQDPGATPSDPPNTATRNLESEIDQLARELEELRERLDAVHSDRLRRLRIEMDSLNLDLHLPEDFELPSFEELSFELPSFEELSFEMDSIWSGVDLEELWGTFDRDALEEAMERRNRFFPPWDAPILLGARRIAGAELSELNPSLGRYFGAETGVLVVEVTPGSPAAEAGLEPGDVIRSVEGEGVADVAELRRALIEVTRRRVLEASGEPTEVVLEILRDRGARELILEIGE